MYVATIDDLLELARKPSMGGVYSIFYPIYEESVYPATMCFIQFQHMNFLHHRIKIQQHPSPFYLQPSSTSRQSQITRSQIHRSHETIFFLCKDKKMFLVDDRGTCEHQGGASSVGPERVSGVASVTSTTRSLECYPATSARPRRQLKRERDKKRVCLLNNHVFYAVSTH